MPREVAAYTPAFVLTIGTQLVTGPVELMFDIALERHFRIFTIERRGVIWDSRCVPPLETPVEAHAMFYFVLDGSIVWRTPKEQRFDGPTAFLLHEEAMEGASKARSTTLRSWGEPFRALELRVRSTVVRLGRDQPPTPIELADRVWSAVRVYIAAARAHNDHDARVRLAKDVLKALQDEGLILTDLASTITEDDYLRQRAWNGLVPYVRKAAFGATLGELASTADVSLKQVSRQMDKLLTFFRLAPMQWRPLSRRYRLRVAILLLSNPTLAIAEVARVAGYSSAEALTHAFYSEGVPAPTELRAAILG